MRHEPGERPEERRLARAGRPEERDHLARLDPQGNVRKRRTRRTGVGEREPVDLR
jgi:hypothetical protein